jgi:Sec-independent protein translocase protein TatA
MNIGPTELLVVLAIVLVLCRRQEAAGFGALAGGAAWASSRRARTEGEKLATRRSRKSSDDIKKEGPTRFEGPKA